MATTLKVANGDFVVNGATGRPKTIGNNIGVSDKAASKEKSSQDLRGGLSINRIASGAGAGISELVGVTQELGPDSTSILVSQRIRDMVLSIIKLQLRRSNIRPVGEKFSRVSLLQVIPKDDKTSFRFRLDVRTLANETLTQSGSLG